MDVINAEQAKIAEEAGACAVMALERSVVLIVLFPDYTNRLRHRVPSDIRKEGGVARMSEYVPAFRNLSMNINLIQNIL